MSTFHIAVVPVGKVDREETAAAIGRAAKILRQPMELRGSLPVPRVSEDPVRGQHRAATLMKLLRTSVLQLGPGAVLKLEKSIEAPADLYLKDSKFAEAEVVVVDNQFAVRIKEIVGAGVTEGPAENNAT